jgi:hypothetical protein
VGDRRRREAARLDLDAPPQAERGSQQFAHALVRERLAAGHHEQRRLAERAKRREDLGQRRGLTPPGVPRVLAVAPPAPDVAALQAQEVCGRSGGRAFALQREEALRDPKARGQHRCAHD